MSELVTLVGGPRDGTQCRIDGQDRLKVPPPMDDNHLRAMYSDTPPTSRRVSPLIYARGRDGRYYYQGEGA